MSEEGAREERAFAAANARRVRSESADKTLDAAMEEVIDWRAFCHTCNSHLIGSKAELMSHAEGCCKRD